MYIHGSEERLIQTARGDKINGLEAASDLERSKKEKRLEDWEEKVLHGQYLRQTKEVRSDQCWTWLQNEDLNRETESLKESAQNQSIRTNLVKAKIDKSQGDSLYTVCRKVDEIIDHIVSTHKNIFACLFSIHNTISLSRHEQVCLSGLRFQRYFFHHRAT